MLEPTNDGDFEGWAALAPTLTPLLADQVGAMFLPWSAANALAIAEAEDEFDVTLKDKRWTQKPQKYHARSLGVLRAKYAEVAADADLDALLTATGCKEHLAA